MVNRDDGSLDDLTDSPRNEGNPSWSPDGSKIAFDATTSDGNRDVFTVNVNGDGGVGLTDNSGDDYDPAWQPLVAGDVNCRGGVTSLDALLVLQLTAGKVSSLACQDRADVSGDGIVSSVDAALILQYVAGFLDRLPP